MTDAECRLWFALRDRRFAEFKFRRQVPVGPFVADFVCYKVRVIIEVDGGQHAESQSDLRRDWWFAANDFLVLRYWNNDVLRNLEGVLTSLLATFAIRPRAVVMSATALPPRAAADLPADAPLLAEIFRASIDELAADDYSESQREAWAAVADDEAAFGDRLAQPIDASRDDGRLPVGFASLKAPDVIDMLYVHPAAGENGVATMLVNALEKLAAARGAAKLTADVSDSAVAFFKQARVRAADPQHTAARRRVARQYDDGKEACREGEAQ